MQDYEIKQQLDEAKEQIEQIRSLVDLASLKEEIKTLDAKTYEGSFWDDAVHAKNVMKRLNQLKEKFNNIESLKQQFDDLLVLKEFHDAKEDVLSDLSSGLRAFFKQAKSLQLSLLLNEPHDTFNAMIEIHPGAGGTESQDWADMLYRMYRRYGEQKGYTFDLIDYLSGDEAGLKRVTFALKGTYAYGYLKAEHGVHRLVRISPFDSGGRRHTSFASITVFPELDDTIDVEINEQDLKIDTYRSSGAGGQSVNTTDSAVRIIHQPTGIVVTVQNERSQIKNKDKAMSILKSKLYQLEQEKQKEELSKFRSDGANSFGSQIRSYVMHPYSMVKDHRTNEETGNVKQVLDGNIDPFIHAYLQLIKGDTNETS